MPDSANPPTQSKSWKPRDKDKKTYGHFDRRISDDELISLTNNPTKVAQHPFFPLLLFYEEWTKFRDGNGPAKKKIRPIRYAARSDAAIYAKYRADLSVKYEAELRKRGIETIPTAHRAIPNSKKTDGNKSNIDFAYDAFSEIKKMGNCVVTIVDIASYFESIDHIKIRKNWELLIGRSLPPDHEAVYKSITRYAVVDYEKAFERLELRDKNDSGTRKFKRQRKIDTQRSNGHVQFCSMKDFRDKICGGDKSYKSLVVTNGRNFGIPQGTPISDLIANFYLLDFDELVNNWVKSRNGVYFRYSDDLIIILPQSMCDDLHIAKDFLQANIAKFGERLKIQDKKVVVGVFEHSNNEQSYRRFFGAASRNGLEYLGFSYDGKIVSLKDATLSNAWRKFYKRSYGFAWRYVKRYRDKGEIWIRENYPYEWLLKKIIQNVSYSQDTGPESWTFLRYVSRARKKFEGFQTNFSSQTRNYRRNAAKNIDEDLNEVINRHL